MLLRRLLPVKSPRGFYDAKKRLSTAHTQNNVFLIRPDGRYTKSSLTTSECLSLLPPTMRLQDLRTGNRQISNFLVRDDYVVVIIEHILAIITSTECLLLRAESDNIAALASKLSVALRNKHSPGEIFEFIILQEMLEAICQEFETRLSLLDRVVNKILSSIYSRDSDESIYKLVPLTRSLTTFQFSVKELFSTLDALLQNDMDLQKMCLTCKSPENRIEVELLIEEYYKKVEEINNEITQLQKNIANTQEVIQMSLSQSRNDMMRLNLYISLLSMGFAAGSMIASIFGMNLLSGMEAHPTMFWYVACAIPLVSCTASAFFATHFIYKTELFKSKSRQSMTSTFFEDIHSLHYIKRLAGTQNPQALRKILSEALGEDLSQEESNDIWQVTSRWEKKNYLVNETEFLDRFYGPRYKDDHEH